MTAPRTVDPARRETLIAERAERLAAIGRRIDAIEGHVASLAGILSGALRTNDAIAAGLAALEARAGIHAGPAIRTGKD